ncbi:hypothetical protein [Nocardia sp. NBC_00881]|uniref:hypothetical protein n=1 Tax=Nocardia sp. NBC_00881 TaxID=2975995 RepID=UPI0038691DEC
MKSIELLRKRGLLPERDHDVESISIIAVCAPQHARRVVATFEKQCPSVQHVSIVTAPVSVENYIFYGLRSESHEDLIPDHVVVEILREVKGLRETPRRGHIVEQEIPRHVLAAYHNLTGTFLRQFVERLVAQGHQDQAVALLQERFGDKIFRWVRNGVRQPRLAREITDEAFEGAVDRFAEIGELAEIGESDVEEWVVVNARNLMAQHDNNVQADRPGGDGDADEERQARVDREIEEATTESRPDEAAPDGSVTSDTDPPTPPRRSGGGHGAVGPPGSSAAVDPYHMTLGDGRDDQPGPADSPDASSAARYSAESGGPTRFFSPHIATPVSREVFLDNFPSVPVEEVFRGPDDIARAYSLDAGSTRQLHVVYDLGLTFFGPFNTWVCDSIYRDISREASENPLRKFAFLGGDAHIMAAGVRGRDSELFAGRGVEIMMSRRGNELFMRSWEKKHGRAFPMPESFRTARTWVPEADEVDDAVEYFTNYWHEQGLEFGEVDSAVTVLDNGRRCSSQEMVTYAFPNTDILGHYACVTINPDDAHPDHKKGHLLHLPADLWQGPRNTEFLPDDPKYTFICNQAVFCLESLMAGPKASVHSVNRQGPVRFSPPPSASGIEPARMHDEYRDPMLREAVNVAMLHAAFHHAHGSREGSGDVGPLTEEVRSWIIEGRAHDQQLSALFDSLVPRWDTPLGTVRPRNTNVPPSAVSDDETTTPAGSKAEVQPESLSDGSPIADTPTQLAGISGPGAAEKPPSADADPPAPTTADDLEDVEPTAEQPR